MEPIPAPTYGRKLFRAVAEQVQCVMAAGSSMSRWLVTLWLSQHSYAKSPFSTGNQSSNPYLAESMSIYRRVLLTLIKKWVTQEQATETDSQPSPRVSGEAIIFVSGDGSHPRYNVSLY